MECTNYQFDLSEYCRICLNRNSLQKMFELDAFLPIIRCIAQTQLLTDQSAPKKICGSCANGLILANIFRMKVIESNGKCRELLKTMKDSDNMKEVNSQESIDRIQENIGKVNTRRKKERIFEYPGSVLKVEVEEYDDSRYQDIDSSVENDENDSKLDVKNVLDVSCKQTCVVCGTPVKENNPMTALQSVLQKILYLRENETSELICETCTEATKAGEKLFEIREKVRIVKQESEETERNNTNDECQFCLINDVFSTRTPKYLVQKFNLMPLCRENEDNKINSDAKSCKECMKLLKQVFLLLNLYAKRVKMLDETIKVPVIKETRVKSDPNKRKSSSSKRKSKKKRLLDIFKTENDYLSQGSEEEETIPLSKFVKRRKRKLKLRPSPKYVKPSPRASIPEDYQCHMSDFEEEESDSGIVTPCMGEPLNRPFRHKYKPCSDCKLKFITDFELEVHIDVVHRTKGDICEHCNKKFINFVGLKAHKHKVHFADCSSVSLFRELCEICGVLTKTLEEHQSVHSDLRPFVCHLCGHSSKTKDLLAAHVRAIHTGEKRYGCKYCDKRFAYSADRARHEISSHTKQYKYVCRTCNKGFLKKNFLMTHQKTHEGTFVDEV